MATKLTKPIIREVMMKDEQNQEGPVVVTISQDGVELRRKGTKRKLNVTWNELAQKAELPGDAPAKFLSNSLGWLVEKDLNK